MAADRDDQRVVVEKTPPPLRLPRCSGTGRARPRACCGRAVQMGLSREVHFMHLPLLTLVAPEIAYVLKLDKDMPEYLKTAMRRTTHWQARLHVAILF
jgi:hypothetical protein